MIDDDDTLLAAADFKIGDEFTSAGGEKRWRVTDVGSRVVVALWLDPMRESSWFNGPPYAVVEEVFDEYDLEGVENVEHHHG